MKKEKLLVKEINVLSNVISKKVNEERRKVVDEKVKKDKEYLGLVKKIDEYNKKLGELGKIEKGFEESIKKIEKKLGLGSRYEGKGRIGYLSYNNVLNSNYRRDEFNIIININDIWENEIYNKLMIENIDGDLKVDDLINRVVKEFVG